jgi:hypothetical protein
MTDTHDAPKRVGEPVQVYLDVTDRERLGRLTGQLDLTKSDVLRQALRAFEQQVLDPAGHPALRIIALADGETAPPADYDVARDHDRFLGNAEAESWHA